MRDLRVLDKYRMAIDADLTPPRLRQFGGAFEIPIDGVTLRVIATSPRTAIGDEDFDPDWDHVSVSLKTRCPTWEEMSAIQRMFFKPTECAMQLHVPEKEHINNHEYCLHIWRPVKQNIPRPPNIMVGHKSFGKLKV